MAQGDLSRIFRKLRTLTLLRPPESLRRGSLMLWLSETASDQGPRLAPKGHWAGVPTAKCGLLHPLVLPWWLRQERICLQCGRPGLGRSLGGGHGNPLQYSCLENPMGRGAWWATVHGVAKKSDTTERLSTAASHKESWVWKNKQAFISGRQGRGGNSARETVSVSRYLHKQ